MSPLLPSFFLPYLARLPLRIQLIAVIVGVRGLASATIKASTARIALHRFFSAVRTHGLLLSGALSENCSPLRCPRTSEVKYSLCQVGKASSSADSTSQSARIRDAHSSASSKTTSVQPFLDDMGAFPRWPAR